MNTPENPVRPKVIITDVAKIILPPDTTLYELKKFVDRLCTKYGQSSYVEINSLMPIHTKVTYKRFETDDEYVIRRMEEETASKKKRNNIFKIKFF